MSEANQQQSSIKGWHEFVPGTICNVLMCDVCDERYDHPNHHTGITNPTEDTERILKRRRALMPGYDEALEEWLS